MTEVLLRMGLSNALFAPALALLATGVGATVRRPQLAHLLWLLVLLKLVTPPLVTIPVVAIPQAPTTAAAVDAYARLGLPFAGRHAPAAIGDGGARVAAPVSSRPPRSSFGALTRKWLPLLWLTGCGLVCAASLFRAARFNRLLTRECRQASRESKPLFSRCSAHRPWRVKSIAAVYWKG